CISARVETPTRLLHKPTGAQICILPAPRLYRAIRKTIVDPYAETVDEAVGEVRGVRRAWFAMLKNIGPYMATPLRLLAREIKQEGCAAILCQEYENPRFDACVLVGKWLGRPVFATFQGGDCQFSRLERLVRP